jgi:preprotein translocase subunit SecG
LTTFLYVLIFIVALLLIGLILIQPSKSGGMGTAFGGIGESVFGGKAGSHLTKTTVIMTTIFFIVALVLAALIGHSNGGESKNVMSKVAAKSEEVAETTPAPAGLNSVVEQPAAEKAVPAEGK